MRDGIVEVPGAFSMTCKVCGCSNVAVESVDQQARDLSNPFSMGRIRFCYDVYLVCNGCSTASRIWSTATPPMAPVERITR